jgi:hypothetical protein
VGNVASSHVTVGSGDHHILALHGWFGSAIEEFLGRD